jgi:AraC-like DNA-binding protein
MGKSKNKRIPEFITTPEQELPEIFTDERHVLSGGEDIQMIHYHQRKEMDKAYFTLHKNILSIVIHGRKQIYHPYGKLTVLPMEGFFLQKGIYLSTERRPDDLHGYESLIILLPDTFLQSLGPAQATSPGPVIKNGSDRAFLLQQDILVTELIHQFLHYFQVCGERARIEAVLPMKIRELMALLIGSPGNKGFGSLINNLSFQKEGELNALMEAHFREPLSLDQWAFLAGLSLSSFKRKFEAAYVMPPRKWIQQRRLQEAYNLLNDERLNVTEVCYSVGFENLAHFVHAFKEQFHITPKQRQLLTKETSRAI